MLRHIEKPDTFNGCASSNIYVILLLSEAKYIHRGYLVYYWLLLA